MKRLTIQRSWCKGCRICAAFCPKEALALDAEGKAHVKNPAACIFCGMCALRCPDMAIDIRDEEGEAASPPDGNAQPGGRQS